MIVDYHPPLTNLKKFINYTMKVFSFPILIGVGWGMLFDTLYIVPHFGEEAAAQSLQLKKYTNSLRICTSERKTSFIYVNVEVKLVVLGKGWT